MNCKSIVDGGVGYEVKCAGHDRTVSPGCQSQIAASPSPSTRRFPRTVSARPCECQKSISSCEFQSVLCPFNFKSQCPLANFQESVSPFGHQTYAVLRAPPEMVKNMARVVEPPPLQTNRPICTVRVPLCRRQGEFGTRTGVLHTIGRCSMEANSPPSPPPSNTPSALAPRSGIASFTEFTGWNPSALAACTPC